MTKTIYYGYENNVRKGCETFIKRGDVLALGNLIATPGDKIVVAEEPNDPFLKAMEAEYGLEIVAASDVPNGLTAEQERDVEHLRTYGYDFEKAAETLDLPLYDVALSKAYNHCSRIEKAAELDD